jgi:hypothetical protein
MRPLALLLAVTAVLAGAEAAHACSCAFMPAERLLARSDGAIVARHLDVRPVQGSALAEVDFIYRVGRVYDGGPGLRRGNRIAVRTNSDDSACGLIPTIGKLTGLFLTRAQGRWTSGLCLQISPRRMRRAGEARPSGAARGCDGPAAVPG